MKIFIVEGQTGEYSDNVRWIIKAFQDEDHAKALVEKASARAREIYISKDWDSENEFDPHMTMDYTGTMYAYTKTELVLNENKL